MVGFRKSNFQNSTINPKKKQAQKIAITFYKLLFSSLTGRADREKKLKSIDRGKRKGNVRQEADGQKRKDDARQEKKISKSPLYLDN